MSVDYRWCDWCGDEVQAALRIDDRVFCRSECVAEYRDQDR